MSQPQGYFQPGFTASQGNILPTTLNGINPAYYDQVSQFIRSTGGNWASFYGVRWFDVLRVDAGTMPTKQFVFFAQGLNSEGALFISGTQYTKQQIDTNLQDDGRLPKDYQSLIWGMGCIVELTGTIDTSVQTSGDAINLALSTGLESNVAGAASVVLQANQLRAIQESLYVEFFINNATFENGTLNLFPAGPYGIAGGVSVDGDNFVNEGALNNGLGYCYSLPIMRFLPDQTRFGVRLYCQNPFINVAPFRLRFFLEGIAVAPITG